MLNKAYAKVKLFHETFAPWSLPKDEMPRMLGEKRASERYKFMLEEIDEFKDAETITDQADAMIDLIYFALGTMVEMGIEPDELFQVVQDANMAKIWPDGKVHLNDDSKVIKPEGWEDPYPKLEAIIKGQAFRKKMLSTSFRVKGTHFVTGNPGPPK